MHRLFRVLSVLIVTIASTTGARAATYNKLYVFGDSYSDIGAGYLDGNGPTAVAYLAQKMNIPLTHSNDPHADNQSIDFAVTAAGTGTNPGQRIGGYLLMVGMMNQVQDFAARVHSKSITFNPDTTLIFIQGGLNDGDVPTKTTIDNITREIEILKAAGGRHITLGLLPTKVPDFAKVGSRLNPAYIQLVRALRQKLGIDIQLNHFGQYVDEVLENPSRYGIVNTDKPCAGRALFGEDPTPCKAPDTYFYFHSGHPSKAVNKILADKLYAEIDASTH
jgi:phospholipase/lecithinase/hemolysin